jgi:hypothetical protein
LIVDGVDRATRVFDGKFGYHQRDVISGGAVAPSWQRSGNAEGSIDCFDEISFFAKTDRNR